MEKKKAKKLTDAEIIELITPHRDKSKQYQQELSTERERLYRAYRAEKYGNEIPGWSQTVHPTIMTAVEWLKPGLVDIFSADFFQFSPVKAVGDNGLTVDRKASAERLKAYVRAKMFNQLDGEQIVEDFVHNCLVDHYGVLKVCHKDEYDIEEEKLPRASYEEVAALLSSDKEIVDISGGYDVTESDNTTGTYWAGIEGAKIVRRKTKYSGFHVEVVPAKELYFLPGYSDIQRCPFVAHVVKRDLDYVRRQEMAGVYRKGSYTKVKEHVDQKKDNPESSGEYYAQFSADGMSIPDSGTFDKEGPDSGNAEVWVWECYVKLAYDSDLLKPCIVTMCEDVVLREPVENPYGGPPFELGYLFKEPGKIVGRPLPAILEDRQKVLTNLLRLIQDSAAKSCYGGFIVGDAQSKKALESWCPNAVAQIPSLTQYREVTPQAPSQFVLRAFDLTLQEVAKESGVNENMQGLDNNSLNKTAAGMNMRLTAGMQRQKLYAKRIARAFKRMFKRILDIIRMYPPTDDVDFIGLDVSLQPGDTEGQYSVIIDVGVGPQDMQNQAQQMDQVLQFQMQAGLPNGLCGKEHVLRAFQAKLEYMDMSGDDYVFSPEQMNTLAQMQGELQKAQGAIAQLNQRVNQMNQAAPPQTAWMPPRAPQMPQDAPQLQSAPVMPPQAQSSLGGM